MGAHQAIGSDVLLGRNVFLAPFINLYGCRIGDNTKIGAFVEVQRNATIGRNCKISSHTFICEGVHIKDGCFIGHGVVFINDNRPQAVTTDGRIETEIDWKYRLTETVVDERARIGSNATILGGLRIGAGAIVGAGSVVTHDVPPGEIWAGNPARRLQRQMRQEACPP